MKNIKGFTMIELLGTITIMGILLGVAVPAVSRHIARSREQAYETLLKTSYEAAQSKATNTMADPTSSPSGIEYSIIDLAKEGYMDDPIDPQKDRSLCTGTVKITGSTNASGMNTYKYKVVLTCSGKTRTRTFDTDGTVED